MTPPTGQGGQFRLVSTTDEAHHFNLGNTYREYLDAPKPRRRDVLTRLVRSWVEGKKHLPTEFEDAAHDLLPAVRSRSLF